VNGSGARCARTARRRRQRAELPAVLDPCRAQP
jgi:hypothetical protein